MILYRYTKEIILIIIVLYININEKNDVSRQGAITDMNGQKGYGVIIKFMQLIKPLFYVKKNLNDSQ